MMHPPHDGGMGHRQPPLRHHLDQVTVAEFDAQIPPDSQDDDFLVEVATPNSSSRLRKPPTVTPSAYRKPER